MSKIKNKNNKKNKKKVKYIQRPKTGLSLITHHSSLSIKNK